MIGTTGSRVFKAALCTASALMLLCACATNSDPIQTPDENMPVGSKSGTKIVPTQFSAEETAAMKKVADQYLNDILTGLKDRNYKLFIKNYTDEMKIDINEGAFKVMVDQFNEKKGPYITRQYLGDLTQGFFKIFLWKAQFEPPKALVDEAKKLGKKPETLLRSDTLIRLEIAKIGNDYVVMGFYFQ